MNSAQTTRGWSISARIGYYTGPREANGCRLWTASTTADGYATTMGAHRKMMQVTRIMLGLSVGDPLVAMHKCDTPQCVEPSHLIAGTQGENIADCIAKGRQVQSAKTHCKRGHIFDDANTYRRTRGISTRRQCRPCNALAAAALRSKKSLVTS